MAAEENGTKPKGDGKGLTGAHLFKTRCPAYSKRTGEPCRQSAGHATNHPGFGHCKWHGGNTPMGEKHAAKLMAEAAVQSYGVARDVDPETALLEELHRTAGHVGWLQLQINTLDESELSGPVGSEGTNEQGVTMHPKIEPSIWLRLYQAERKHFADVAADCVKAGIAKRQIELAEEQGKLIAQVIEGVLGDLKIPPEKARPVVRKHLSLVAQEVA